MFKRSLIMLMAVSLSGWCIALTDAWNVDVARPGAVQRTYPQGEEITATVSVRNGFKPLDLTGCTARFLWYTNTTDNLWWTNTATIANASAGTITFTWNNSMDVGAALYYYWIGIWTSSAAAPVWRISGTIRMSATPGFVPNTLAPPVRAIDFDLINVLNPPWPSVSALNSVSNTLASASAANTANISALAGSHVLLQSLVATNTAQIAALNTYNTTSRVDRLWANATNYMDGAGNFHAESLMVNTNYYCTDVAAYTSLSLILSDSTHRRFVLQPTTGNSYYFYDERGNYLFYYHLKDDITIRDSKHGVVASIITSAPPPFAQQLSFYENGNYAGTFQLEIVTNVISRVSDTVVTTNGTVIITGSLEDASGSTTGLTARAGAEILTMDFYGRSEAQAAISEIPRVPTNATTGWLVYDYGSNIWLNVTVSNLNFEVYEVEL